MKKAMLLLLPLSLFVTSTNYSTTNDFTAAAYFGSGLIMGAAGLATCQYVISKNPTTSTVTRGVVYGSVAGVGAATATFATASSPIFFLIALACVGSISKMYSTSIISVIKKDNPTADIITTRENDGYLAFATTTVLTTIATCWLILEAIAKKANDSK